MRKDGADPRVLASNLQEPEGVFADTAGIVWTEVGSGKLWRANLDGSSATLIRDTHSPGALAVVADSTSIYWIDLYTTSVFAAPRSGIPDGGAPLLLSHGEAYLFGIAQDATNIYFSAEGSWAVGPLDDGGIQGRILKVAKDGGTGPMVVADGQADPRYLAVDGTGVYWANTAGDSVVVLRTGQTMPVEILHAKAPFGVAVDATDVYVTTWGTDSSDGTIVRVRKDGTGVPLVLATGLSFPSKIAVDATAVYWGNTHGGSVMKLAK